MWLPSRAELAASDAGTAFTLLAWHELFAETTADSFRPRLYDTLSFLEELRTISKEADTDNRWRAYLPEVMEEAICFMESSSIIPRHYWEVLHGLKRHTTRDNPQKVHSLATVLLESMSNYHKVIENCLSQAAGTLPATKRDMLEALNHFATRVRAEGVHRLQCQQLDFQALLSKSTDDALADILRVSSSISSDWECIIALDSKGEHRNIIGNSGFVTMQASQKPLGEIGEQFLQNTKGCLRAVAPFQAHGAAEAIARATESIQRFIDISNFAYSYNAIRLSDWVLARKGRTQVLVNVKQHGSLNIQPRRQTGSMPNDVLSQLPLNCFPDQLSSALEQYTIAQTSADPKVRFVNLWVALETLVGKGLNSTPQRVADALAPVLTAARTRKILKYLSISLHHFKLLKHAPECAQDFPLSSAKEIRPDELLLVLCGKSGKDAQKRLCNAVAPHRLLMYRLFNCHEEVIDNKKLRASLLDSRKRCTWQIQRIYRERNLLIHTGRCSPSLSYLCDNLHHYFTSSVWSVIRTLTKNNTFSVHDCFTQSEFATSCSLHTLTSAPRSYTVGHIFNQQDSPYHNCTIF